MSPPHPPRPRKLRSGRRQFPAGGPGGSGPGGMGPTVPGMHPGTDQEWEQVMQNPDVQRALRDPSIASALYQNMQQTLPGGMAGIVPPPQQAPVRMQMGGASNALDVNEIVQMLNDPNATESRKQSLRMSLARMMQMRPPAPQPPQEEEEEAPARRTLRYQRGGVADPTATPEEQAERAAGSRSPAQMAQMQRIGFNPDTATPQQPLRFQGGGQLNTMDLMNQINMLTQKIIDENKRGDTQAAANDQALLRSLQAQQLAAVQQYTPGLGGTFGGTSISPTTMAGLQKIAGTGVTTGNTLAAAGMGALAGLGTTRNQGLAALVGAGMGAGINYLVRKYGKKPGTADTTKGTGAGSVSPPANTPPSAADQPPKPPSPPSPPPTVPGPTRDPAKDLADVPADIPGLSQIVGKYPPDSSQTATGPNIDIASSPGGSGASSGQSGPGLWMGSANSPSGNVVSNDGMNWRDEKTRQPWSGAVSNPTQITPGSSLIDATPATTIPATPQPGISPGIPGISQSGSGIAPRWPGGTGGLTDLYGTGIPGMDQSLTSGLGAASVATLPDQIPADVSGLGSTGLSEADFLAMAQGYREGGEILPPARKSPKAVLLRKPMGMPIPILHTTIVIAAKPSKGKKKSVKSEKKQVGGVIRPAKPHLLPPKRGPQDGEGRPRPHGRVQVPRGSGAAIRGKEFGGIF